MKILFSLILSCFCTAASAADYQHFSVRSLIKCKADNGQPQGCVETDNQKIQSVISTTKGFGTLFTLGETNMGQKYVTQFIFVNTNNDIYKLMELTPEESNTLMSAGIVSFSGTQRLVLRYSLSNKTVKTLFIDLL